LTAYSIDPIEDSRWDVFVERHARASVFHTAGWLKALRDAYGYRSLAVTTSPPGADLRNGIVVTRVESRITGRRLVSVPFADHCEPLTDTAEESAELLTAVMEMRSRGRFRYVELRPLAEGRSPDGFDISGSYLFHSLDLRATEAQLFSRLHRDSIQRKIRRAGREGLQHLEGQSDDLMRAFYRLLTVTRQRHGLPPQPYYWFEHLGRQLADRLTIHVAVKAGTPIASILTLRHRQTIYYKYGASDARHHSSGAMPFLFWRLIVGARAGGVSTLDLGRSDLDGPGLIVFKERLGGARATLSYFRCPPPTRPPGPARGPSTFARLLMRMLPGFARRGAGRLIYPHLG
jgi:hypothetical protein